MKVSFYLENPKGSKRNQEGINPTAIFCRICYEGFKVKYYTPLNILPRFWNGSAKPHRAKETVKFPEYPEFNKRLDNIETAIKNTINKFANDNGNKVPTPDILKPLLDFAIREGGKVKRETFVEFFDKFITHCKDGTRDTDTGRPTAAGTIRSYTTTKGILEAYQKHTAKVLYFDSLDMNFYNDFKRYLALVEKQSVNYISKHFKVIKTALYYEKKYFKKNTKFDFEDFTAATENSDSIYLADYELKEMAALDLSSRPRLDKVRDLFIIGCYTGLRFSDLSTLHPGNISNGMITITQTKTGAPVAIPVHSTVNEIMAKYGGNIPAAISNQKTNDTLKEIAKECEALKKKVSIKFTKGGQLVTKGVNPDIESPEKWRFVTTHTARRSFATNQYLAGIPTLTIMAITGHKTETSFMKYIKVAAIEYANDLKTRWDEKATEKPKRIAI